MVPAIIVISLAAAMIGVELLVPGTVAVRLEPLEGTSVGDLPTFIEAPCR